MKIAYVYDAVYPFVKGGGERRIYEVARRLSQRGHGVFLLGMKYWDGPPSFRDNGIHYRSLGKPLAAYHPSGRRSIPEALGFGAYAWRMLAGDRYDVIDCGQWPYFHLLPAKAYSLLRRIPFIVTWYEVWRRHWLEYLGRPGIFGMAVEKTFWRLPHQLIAVSEITRSDLLELGANPQRVATIPNGIDYSRIQVVDQGPVKTDLAYCGRLKGHKNVHLLIQAVAALKRSLPEISAVIIGDGPEAAALRKLAGELGVAENIRFTGALEDFDEVIRWLKASRVFVNPSTKEGGGSITLFEANACGLPVIAVRCPNGIDPSLIREEANGYFVEPDPERIAERALELLRAPARLAGSAGVCREMASGYDWEVVTSQYEQVYQQAVYPRRSAGT
jgi:glycosyltransferase involved in cell wall biosynthesis